MKIAFVTDTHFGARNDAASFLEYFSNFFDNIFFPYLDEHKIDTVIHLGDIVDRRKFINFNTLNVLKSTFLEPIRERNIDFHCIIGNHDIPYRNTNKINALKELYEGTNVPNIQYYWEPVEKTFGGCDMLFLPWINKENYEQSLAAVNETKAQVCLGHLEIQGFEMLRGVKNDHGLSRDIFNRFELVCSGHFHHKSHDSNIHYLGSPYEIFWSDYNALRGFHIFDTVTRELEFIRNPYRIFHKLVYNDEGKTVDQIVKDTQYDQYKNTYIKVIVQEKTNPYAFDLMLDKLYKADCVHISIVDDHKHLDRQPDEEIINEAEDTMTILTKFVNNLNFEGDNSKLNILMRDLYNEASKIEV